MTRTITTRGHGLIFGADADFTTDSGRYALDMSRGTNPTGSGLMVRTDRIGLQWRREVTERISTNLAASWLKSIYDGNLGAGSRYMTFEPSLSWKLQEQLTLAASYSYVWTRTDNTPGSARSNSVFLTLTYQWSPISLR